MEHSQKLRGSQRSWLSIVIVGLVPLLLLLLAALLVLAVPVQVRAAVITVNDPADNTDFQDGKCTLREAILNADGDFDSTGGDCAAGSGDDTVIMPANTYTLTLGELSVSGLGRLNIIGAGRDTTIIDGNSNDRVLDVQWDTEVLISGVTIRNGRKSSSPGGGIYNDGALQIADSAVISNTAIDYYGGGIGNGGKLTITNSIISHNRSTGEWAGGGIYNAAGPLVISGSTLYSNTSGLFGGSIHCAIDSRTSITNSKILSSTARQGGGLANEGGVVSITGSTLSANRVYSDGGAIWSRYSDSKVYIANSTLSGNRAEGSPSCYGGAVYNDLQAEMYIVDSTLFNNQATGTTDDGWGGGVYNGESKLTIENSTLYENKALSSGGGRGLGGAVASASLMTITHSTLSDNVASANGHGGGIYLYVSTLYMTNTTVSGNQAHGGGGALFSFYATGYVDHTTVSDNVGDADGDGTGNTGGIFAETGTINLKNTILAGNHDNNPSGKAPDCKGVLQSHGFNLIGDKTGCELTGWLPVDLVGGGGNPDIDPMLDPLADNGGSTPTHALQVGSPALDTGICVDISENPIQVDQRMMKRPQGPACDIGAFEAEPKLSVLKTATPDSDVAYHGLVTYTIVVSNAGAGHAEDVEVWDDLPRQVTVTRWLTNGLPAGGQAASILYANSSFGGLFTISGGQSLIWAFVVTHTGDYGETVTNTAYYSHTSGTGSDDAIFSVLGAPVLSISKDVAPDKDVAYHGNVTYTIVVSNSGDSDAYGAAVTDTLPEGVDFLQWLPGGQPQGAQVVDDQVTWEGTVSSSGTVSFAFMATHTGDHGDVILNSAEYGHATGQGSADATFRVKSTFHVYLPVVLRNRQP